MGQVVEQFKAIPSVRTEVPLLTGLIGPPGGGKTVSALRLAIGMQRLRKGPIVLIDTECGRSKVYSPEPGKRANPDELTFDFLRVDLGPPFRSDRFLAAIQAQVGLDPSAIVVDSFSDEHEGEGGYLEWHDDEIPKMGNNEWAAWAKPKAARKRLISGLLQIKTPIIGTFRAREKTEYSKEGNRAKITNIGWMPVAPLEIGHSLNLACVLPPRADGVPEWTSEKAGENFITKLPDYLRPLIARGQLSEDTGEALARWAKGGSEVSPARGGGVARTNAELKSLVTALEATSLTSDQVTAHAVKTYGREPRYLELGELSGLVEWVKAGRATPP